MVQTDNEVFASVYALHVFSGENEALAIEVDRLKAEVKRLKESIKEIRDISDEGLDVGIEFIGAGLDGMTGGVEEWEAMKRARRKVRRLAKQALNKPETEKGEKEYE